MEKWMELTDNDTGNKMVVNTGNITSVVKTFSDRWTDDGMERQEHARIYFTGAGYTDVRESYTVVKQMIKVKGG